MTNPNRAIVTVAMYNDVVRDLVKTNAENEQLRATLVFVREQVECNAHGKTLALAKIDAALEQKL